MTQDINPSLQLQLLSTDLIVVSEIPVYPVSIKKIAEIGYSKFSKIIKLLCIGEYEINKIIKEEISINPFDFICAMSENESDFKKLILEGLNLITHQKADFSKEELAFLVGENKIDKENFSEIQEIIKLRNGFSMNTSENGNPSNETARKLLERRRTLRNKLLSKKNENENLTLADLVSILASGMKLPLPAVLEYDIYQFNDQFNRLKIFDDYKINILALLHGAGKENINFRHWISKTSQEF